MKTIYTMIFLLYGSAALMAQDTAYSYFDKDWNETTKSKAIFYRKVFKGTNQLWMVSDYYMSGKIQMTGSYTGKDLRYKQGKFIYYHPNGRVSSEANYVNDTIFGNYTSYYENGKIMTKYYSEHGVTFGIYESYYEDGQLEMKAQMKNDVQHGLSEYYSPSGKISSSGQFVNGSKHGEWKYYDDNGGYLSSEFHYQTFASPCTCTLNFENDRWIYMNPDSFGKIHEHISLDMFHRRDAKNKEAQNVLFILNAACFHDIGDQGFTSESIAGTIMKNKKVKSREVKSINGKTVNLNGGALYYCEEKINGDKKCTYLYVRLVGDKAIELFFEYDSSLKDEYLDEIANIINGLTW